MSYPQQYPHEQQQQSYPQQQAPTISANSATASLGLQMPFLRTPIGILLIIEMVFGVIALACGAQGDTAHGGWFLFVSIVAWFTTIAWFVLYFINVPEAKPIVPWTQVYLIYNIVIGILYFIAFIVILAKADGNKPYIAAGVFGIFLTICYGVSGFLTFQKIRS